jgi:hypothetical protein
MITLKEKQHDLSSRINLSLDNKQYRHCFNFRKEMTTGPFLLNDCFQLFSASESIGGTISLPAVTLSEIENTGFNELKTSINIKIEQQEAQTFMLQTSLTKSFNKDYFIILLDSIHVIEKKKKEAWINLMKIISHE